MSKSKKIITKSDWIANFNLIGEAKINDFTFKIDEKSEKSSWIYNNLNLGVDCGEKYGVVYCSAMGGYSEERENYIYAHGKKDDGTDDFENRIQVAWEDRFDSDIIDSLGDLCFITVGLERTDKGKVFYKKFLSEYDAIAYIKEHLEEDTVVNVRGNIRYSFYQEQAQAQKHITSIVLSKADNPEKYRASFVQTVLIDKSSASLKSENVDKEKGIMYVSARVLDYLKELNGVEVRGQYPFPKEFEFALDLKNEKACKMVMDKVFKVKKDITQITFEGKFISGGAVVIPTWEEVPDDIKDLVECGLYTREEALQRCSVNGKREERMILLRPYTRQVGEEKTVVLQKFDQRYTEEDLVLDYLTENDTESEGLKEPASDKKEEDTDDAREEESGENMDWLNDVE